MVEDGGHFSRARAIENRFMNFERKMLWKSNFNRWTQVYKLLMNFLRIENWVFAVKNVQSVRIRDEKYVPVAATVKTITILIGRLCLCTM